MWLTRHVNIFNKFSLSLLLTSNIHFINYFSLDHNDIYFQFMQLRILMFLAVYLKFPLSTEADIVWKFHTFVSRHLGPLSIR